MRTTEVFRKHLRERRAVQVIDYGFDLENIKRVATAAQQGMASSVCVSASKDTIRVARENTRLTVFAASYNPFRLQEAMKEGADGIFIGNYSDIYKKDILLGVKDVYEMAVEAITLTKSFKPFVGVTIPGYLDTEKQIELARKLEILGVDIVQTEGSVKYQSRAIKGSYDAAKISIANTLDLADTIGLPVMTSGGLTENTVPSAFTSGARAVGVGSCINKMDTQIGMTAMVRNIVGSIAYNKRASRELREESLRMEIPSFFG